MYKYIHLYTKSNINISVRFFRVSNHIRGNNHTWKLLSDQCQPTKKTQNPSDRCNAIFAPVLSFLITAHIELQCASRKEIFSKQGDEFVHN